MNPFAILKRVSFKNLLRGTLLGLRHPLLVWPTIKATRECVRISTVHYGKLHHKNGPANAFRHALWNHMIARACLRWGSKEGAVRWAEKITHWHEEAFPNEELARNMDLHNNAVGRYVFEQNLEKSEKEIIALLQNMTLNSVKVEEGTDLSIFKNQLVHCV